MSTHFNPALGFFRSVKTHPDNAFLSVGGSSLTYAEMEAKVSRLAHQLRTERNSGRVGVLGTRSLEAYVGILASCWAGSAYVPLNLKWPEARLIALLEELDLDALVVDRNGANLLTPSVLEKAPRLIYISDTTQAPEPASGQTITRLADLPASVMPEPAEMTADDLAYVIFTSGTTGLPKGVMISAGNLASYLDQSEHWTGYTPDDRIGEACDVTFDLSVHNLFLCTRAAASLHVMAQLELLAPSRFIRRHELTVWMSVPTVIGLMRTTGALQDGIFPSLRLSIFCGEPLPVQAVQAWAKATPNGRVENIYGPTEATVICTRQTLTTPPVETPSRGILAIGSPYEAMKVAIFDENQNSLPDNTPGEIALAGPQLGIGYFGKPELTDKQFRMIRGERWYLTGDLGSRDENGVFHHLGRVDNQIKLKGNRIELEEVDMHLRAAAGTELAATVAWPVTFGSAEGLVSFVAGSARSADDILSAMLEELPRYMVPGAIRVVDTLPQNANGKIDRRALFESLEQEEIGDNDKRATG